MKLKPGTHYVSNNCTNHYSFPPLSISFFAAATSICVVFRGQAVWISTFGSLSVGLPILAAVSFVLSSNAYPGCSLQLYSFTFCWKCITSFIRSGSSPSMQTLRKRSIVSSVVMLFQSTSGSFQEKESKGQHIDFICHHQALPTMTSLSYFRMYLVNCHLTGKRFLMLWNYSPFCFLGLCPVFIKACILSWQVFTNGVPVWIFLRYCQSLIVSRS